MIHILNKENTILNKFLAQIRDREVQTDSMRFRRNMERIGEVMAYEISRTLDYRTTMVETPLGEAVVEMIGDNIVFLRNGVKEWQGSRHEIFHADNEALNDFVFASELFKKVKSAAQ